MTIWRIYIAWRDGSADTNLGYSLRLDDTILYIEALESIAPLGDLGWYKYFNHSINDLKIMGTLANQAIELRK